MKYKKVKKFCNISYLYEFALLNPPFVIIREKYLLGKHINWRDK